MAGELKPMTPPTGIREEVAFIIHCDGDLGQASSAFRGMSWPEIVSRVEGAPNSQDWHVHDVRKALAKADKILALFSSQVEGGRSQDLSPTVTAVESGWRPIQSALKKPRRGNSVLGNPIYALIPYRPKPQWTVAWWDESYKCFRHVGEDGPEDIQPTHWQPLPPPPSSEDQSVSRTEGGGEP